jgi:DNA-binding MurR/RpiR family transcriptional regulator
LPQDRNAAESRTAGNALPPDHPLALRVRKSFNDLTPGQQRVARLLLELPYEMAFLSVADIGHRAHVSDSTVVRLSAALGYSGFPELRQDVQNSLIARMAPLDLLKQRLERDGAEAPGSIVEVEIENLRLLRESLTSEMVDRAVELILSAGRVHVLGMRSGFGVAHSCAHLLQHVLTNVNFMTLLGGSLPDQLSLLEKGDVLVAFSTPRYSRQIFQVAEYARRIGVDVIAITDRVLSPIGRAATVVIPVPVRSHSFFPSMVAAQAAVYVLASEVTRKRQRAATARLTHLEEISNEFRLFLAGEAQAPARPPAKKNGKGRGRPASRG